MATLQRALVPGLHGALQRCWRAHDGGHASLPLHINAFDPVSLFASGEKGTLQDPADRATVFTDAAGTVLAMTENALVARVNDRSPNGAFAQRVSSTLRPKLAFLAGAYRRAIDYDGVDDSMATTLPAMGSNCTLARVVAGVGVSFQTGLTINAGALQSNSDHCGLLLIDRALTATEIAQVTRWGRQHAGVEDEYNVAYGADPAEVLDIYHSSGHPQGPVLLMVHGGGWRNGSKGSPNVTKSKLQNWLPQGYTFVSVGYKLDVGTDPIDQTRSVAKALAWVQAHARDWDCDPRKVVVMGHSAGGHLVALMTASNAIRAEAGVRPWLATIPLDAAAYDVAEILQRVGHDALYDEPWGVDPAHWAAGSPTLVMTSAPPPMLVVVSTDSATGESDSPNAAAFKAKVESLGGRADWYETPLTHSEVNATLGDPGAYTTAVQAFLTSLGL